MARFWPFHMAVFSVAIVAAGGLVPAICYAQQTTYTAPTNQSWTDSITSPIKQGFDKLGHALSPKPATAIPPPEDDAVSLKGKGKPDAKLYVAIAHLYEQSGKMAEAEQQYQLALKDKPDDLAALVGYARLKEQFGHLDEAIQLYQRAVKACPQQAATHNNLGLCYARQNRLNEAAGAIGYAIQLDSKNPLYRNNLATVLVDQGNSREAFRQLRVVHNEAAAYYNLGYLLNKKGERQAASQCFAMALQADPSMDAARRWFQYLQRPAAQVASAQRLAPGTSVAIDSTIPQKTGLVPPNESTPRRLPVVEQSPSGSEGPALPGISYEGSATPAAPLPPPSTNALVRPLPRVY